MSDRDGWGLRAVVLPAALAALFLSSLVLARSSGNSCNSADAVLADAVSAERADIAAPGVAAGSHDPLDSMRMDALQGNLDASAQLAGRLIVRFEASGEPENLYEAFQWIARDWDQAHFPGNDLVQRVVLRHCHRPVLRWHWLCVSGE